MDSSNYKLMSLLAFSLMVFIRFVDVAVFDGDHQHLEHHARAEIEQVSHDHHHHDDMGHDTEESISAHAGFHALLSVFTFPQFEDFISLLRNASVYEAIPESSIFSVHNGPPVPPPLK
ncbi:hypothetical protein KFE96_06170 [Kordiimonas sp. SCSIO 12603]|uniref:hypothetical protein n=1 Tax=Kordiimonas sp. SCSIO 12603 TaxID=2829596 RepID=UPI002106E656|nr:hypothetical protein [Kordiimonas sp. SCSIO 12603]UTW59885.1 hypothetical protein KFE96_06170 [Kordiimonas sp. SCSIO 12603]